MNPYDLLPTIRSRAVSLHVAPLSDGEMREFAAARSLQDAERRIALAQGSPGLAMSLDLELYDRRRAAMLTLLEVAAGVTPFAAWCGTWNPARAGRRSWKLCCAAYTACSKTS